jgi:hypothetical protein
MCSLRDIEAMVRTRGGPPRSDCRNYSSDPKLTDSRAGDEAGGVAYPGKMQTNEVDLVHYRRRNFQHELLLFL